MNIRKRIIFNRGSSVETAFVMRVKTDNTGTGLNTQFIINTNTAAYTYNYSIATSDGQSFTGQTGNKTITFPTAGTYDIFINGIFPFTRPNISGQEQKLMQIRNWGNIVWRSFENSFINCNNLIVTATDAPDLSLTTNLVAMFRSCGSFTSFNLTGWNTSNITSMLQMFNATTLMANVIGIGTLDLSALTNVNAMFNGNTVLNFQVGDMDISNVTSATSFMAGVTLSTANYDDALIKFAAQAPNALTISFGSSKYTNSGAALAARNTLTSTYSWVITDGGPL